ncbi:MAG: peptidoglycan-binding protein [Geminicoccaceae bacterium]
MISANAFRRLGIHAALLAGLINLTGEAKAQSSTGSDVAAAEDSQEAGAAVDRGKMRLNLLIRLVETELQEAMLRQSRLTVEAAELDQERRSLLAGPSSGSKAEKRRLDVIEKRLQRIDKEMAEVKIRLPEINKELAELQARLDEANGVVREPEADTAANSNVVNGASLWLDGKRQIQEALVYLGGYDALIDGDFGPRTKEAIKVYQGRQNFRRTGSLTDEQEAALLQEANILRARYGMMVIEDLEEGYRLSYPSGLLPEGEVIEPNGRRYASQDGEGELLITSSNNDGESGTAVLSAIYDELLAQYDVQYRRKRRNWYVVAGIGEEGRTVYDTARLNGDRVVRARLSYPAERQDLWSPFAVMMFNTFEAFPAGES